MKYIYKKITLDVHNMTSQLSLAVKQGDTLRGIIVTLVDDGKLYKIPENCYAVFSAQKSDNTFVSDGCIIQNNKITYNFSEQLVAAAGKVDCDITVYDSNNGRITSPQFSIFVYETLQEKYASEAVASDSFKILTDLIVDTKETLAEAEEAIEATAEAVEATEKATAEAVEATEATNEATERANEASDRIDALSLSKGISENSVQVLGNTTGLKGFYWTNIDLSTNKITLDTALYYRKQIGTNSKGEPIYSSEIDYSIKPDGIKFGKHTDDLEIPWEVGDVISIHNDVKYNDCSTITAIEGNVITVDKLPFSTLVYELDVTDNAVFILEKPTTGLVDLGMGAVAFGEGNESTNYMTFSAGWHNKTRGQYGTTFGKENTTGYCGLTAGKKNDNPADHSIVGGENNINDTNATCSILNGKGNFNGGKRALLVGEGNKNNPNRLDATTHGFASILAGTGNISELNRSIVAGNANTDLKGDNLIIAGSGNKGLATNSIIAGYDSTFGDASIGKYAVASIIAGEGCHANDRAVAAGLKAKTYASGSIIVANESEIGPNGYDSAVFGKYNKTNFSRTLIAGEHNEATAKYQTLLGKYSNPTAKTLFAVGNGSATERKNAFEVTDEGVIAAKFIGNLSGQASKANEADIHGRSYRTYDSYYYKAGTYVSGEDVSPHYYMTQQLIASNNMEALFGFNGYWIVFIKYDTSAIITLTIPFLNKELADFNSSSYREYVLPTGHENVGASIRFQNGTCTLNVYTKQDAVPIYLYDFIWVRTQKQE